MVLSPLKNQTTKPQKTTTDPYQFTLKNVLPSIIGEGRSYEDLELLYTCKSSC